MRRELYGDDVAPAFDAFHGDRKPLPLDARHAEHDRIRRQDIACNLHRLQQPQPDNGPRRYDLIGVNSRADCVAVLRDTLSDGGVESVVAGLAVLRHERRIAHRLRQSRNCSVRRAVRSCRAVFRLLGGRPRLRLRLRLAAQILGRKGIAAFHVVQRVGLFA